MKELNTFIGIYAASSIDNSKVLFDMGLAKIVQLDSEHANVTKTRNKVCL